MMPVEEQVKSPIPSWMKRVMTTLGHLAYWSGWPAIHVFLHGSIRTRIIVRTGGDRYLLVRPYLGSGAWKLPGGGVHKTETPVAAATRELFEELGIRAAQEQFTYLAEAEVNENGHRYRAHFLAARVEMSSALVLQWWEISDARWCSLEAIVGNIGDSAVQQAVQVWATR